MSATEYALYAVPALAAAAFFWFRGRAYLMFFQQEEYDGARFLRWMLSSGSVDIWATLIALAGLLLVWMRPFGPHDPAILLFPLMWVAAPLVGAWRSLAPLRGAKKKLVMTARAWRIFSLYLALAALGLAVLYLAPSPTTSDAPYFLALLAGLQAPPFLLVLANWLLKPFEAVTQRKYRREAKEKLEALDPFIIAITGSYGKTSTKHILAHILSASQGTLATPGSVNTEMGIARIVRERLVRKHKYFIVEMGAYGPGSIARLCRLAPPKLGLITSLGHAHYERFRSLETVADAKFELATAVRDEGGKTIVNAAAIPEDILGARLECAGDVRIAGRAGQPFDLSIILKDVAETREGLALTLTIFGQGGARDASFLAPVYGAHQAGNIMMAVAAALELGFPPKTIQAALATLPQVTHRLEVTLNDRGPSVIDDAYNANPVGFAAALDTLAVLGVPGGRRVLITPGMVELGEAHDEKHAELGAKAASCVDLALVVGPERIPSFVAAFEEAKSAGAELRTFARQEEAEAWYKANARDLDVVLFENNLPDLYEAKVRF